MKNEDSMLKCAIDLLIDQTSLIPEKYQIYNGDYLFLAYSKNATGKEKAKTLSPLRLVNVKTKKVGPFSLAFVLNEIPTISKNWKNI